MIDLTFENLPLLVKELSNQITEMKNLVLELKQAKEPEQKDKFLSIEQASEFLNIAKPTVYAKTSRNEIPHIKKGGRLYFIESELIEYLKKGRRKTQTEIEAEANEYIKNNPL